MQKLECAVQNYEWGKPASQSFVAKLKGLDSSDNLKPYAELWMGTHSNGPSFVKDKNISLSEYINAHPESVGEHENGGVQYIFKILSVNKALSIQSHPTKKQAKVLHEKDPKNYPDANHKPEMAIAITQFEVLSGFCVHHEIISNFKAHIELFELVSEKDLAQLAIEHSNEVNRAALKKLFSSIWKSSSSIIASVVARIVEKISKKKERTSVEDLIVRLNSQYPNGDVGVLAPLFLNHFVLQPGEAIFIGPNEPHAYLFGDCVECMANSDNTIRAGLTPKFKDILTLCENLTYNMTPPPYFQPSEKLQGIIEYAPPVDEFAVQKINKNAIEINQVSASSIIIVISGETVLQIGDTEHNLKSGDVSFLPYLLPQTKIQLKASSTNFLAFRAYTPMKKKI